MTKEDKRKVLAELDELARGTSGVVRGTIEDCKRVIRHMKEECLTKVYIAGKITGDSAYREKFRKAQRDLEAGGFIVLNPAELPEGMIPSDYMRICFAMMDCADIVAFLPDYSQSSGARLEFEWCQYTGKQTMLLHALHPDVCVEMEAE